MEMFWATYGGGAFHVLQVPGRGLTEGPIFVSCAGKTKEAVVKTNIPDESERERFKSQIRQLQEEVGAISYEASDSLNMAFVAAGRADGYFKSNLNPWAAAAGYLMVSEAGGKVSDYNGKPFHLLEENQDILVSNRVLHDKFVEILGSV
jgi:myo-inositol-1(or 4)-monophosphatase